MTSEDWLILVGLIDEWWPGRFEETAENAWYVALSSFEADEVTGALKVLLAGGGTFRPSVAEVIAQIRTDPSKPTFLEACRLIYGRNGVLAARTTVRKGFWEAGERERLNDEAALVRAGEIHPLVDSFVARFGIGRLRRLDVDHPEYGELKRRDLEQAWNVHVDAMDGRDVAALVLPRGEGGLRQLDPLSVLGVDRPALNLGQEVS